MNTRDLLLNRLDAARSWTNNLLADIDESRWFDAPGPGIQHIAWQVGHLAASQVVLIHVRCHGRVQTDVLSATFVQQFGRGSKPVADPTVYPPNAEIRRRFDEIHADAMTLIRSMADADFDKPAHGEPHPMFVTRGQAVGMAAMHESFHAGQIALTRRLFGKACCGEARAASKRIVFNPIIGDFGRAAISSFVGDFPMASAALRELIDEQAIVLPLSVKQYHAMIANGILPEGAPYELLDGYLVRKDRSASGENLMTVGHEHTWVVIRLGKLSRRLERMGCHLRTQQPVSLPPFNEPEPDGAIVLGSEDDYPDRQPGAKDVLCVIEVADASLRHDRIVKARIYASNGVAQYYIVNLIDRVIEAYSQPVRKKGRYDHSVILTPGQRVLFPAARGRTLSVAVNALLP